MLLEQARQVLNSLSFISMLNITVDKCFTKVQIEARNNEELVKLVEILTSTVTSMVNNDRTARNFKLYLVDTGGAVLQCVKATKESLGIGLKEAKDLVDESRGIGNRSLLKTSDDLNYINKIKEHIESVGGSCVIE